MAPRRPATHPTIAAAPDVAGRRFVVLGLARTGLGVASLLLRRGARVTGLDLRPRHRLPPGVAALERRGARLVLGPHPVEELLGADVVVISPGIPDLPQVAAAEAAGVRVVSEIEVALWHVRAPVVAVTGTNGKSTVTSLIGAMAARAGRPVFAGANLGNPLSDAIDGPANTPRGLIVAELSSYQLERTPSLHARVAVLLNVTDDHLDRHGSFENYAALKGRVFAGQDGTDDAVIPAGDPVCERLAAGGRATVRRFGAGAEARVEDDELVVRRGGRVAVRIPRAGLRLRGAHNLDNVLAAALAARCAGIPGRAIVEAAARFAGLPHRMQLVGEVNGVAWYDDSKATNVGAALRAIEGLDRRAVWIAGGREKGGSYAPLRGALAERISLLVLIGEARGTMRAALGDVVPCVDAGSLEEAVHRAAAAARRGEAVLLAPACSSFDMFRDYVERGERFAAAVRRLKARTGRREAAATAAAKASRGGKGRKTGGG